MKQHKFKKRSDKIKFLNRLQAGLTNLNELSPGKIRVWRFYKKEKLYENPVTHEKLSEDEYNLLINKQGPPKIIRIHAK